MTAKMEHRQMSQRRREVLVPPSIADQFRGMPPQGQAAIKLRILGDGVVTCLRSAPRQKAMIAQRRRQHGDGHEHPVRNRTSFVFYED